MTPPKNGFRVVGDCRERRRLVDAAAAFSAYAACDQRAEVHRESYLSAFTFGKEFGAHLDATGSTADYTGTCGAPWLWFDIDRHDRDTALADARRLAAFILERYREIDEDALLLFFSGSKGCHVGLPVCWKADPCPGFHAIARAFCEALATAAGIRIDPMVYVKVQPFRAPNSRHPKTGLHKLRLTYDELLGLTADRVADLARQPEAFDPPGRPAPCHAAGEDWCAAIQSVERIMAARAERRAGPTDLRLQRETLDFICNGAAVNYRHARLFRAAANLAEFGCPSTLAHALLSEAGLDCGLPPADVRRQIDCGLAHAARQGEAPKGGPA